MATYYALPTLTEWLQYTATGHTGWSLTSGGPDAGPGVRALSDDYVFDANSGPGRTINIPSGMSTTGAFTISTPEAFTFTGAGTFNLWGLSTLTASTSITGVTVQLSKSTLDPNGAYIETLALYFSSLNYCYIDSDVRLGTLLFSSSVVSGNANYLYLRNGANVTIPTIPTIPNIAYNKLYMGSGTWTFTGIGNVIASSGGITPETCTIKLTNGSGSTATLPAGILTGNNTLWNAMSGAGGFQIPFQTTTVAKFKVTGAAKTVLHPSYPLSASVIEIDGMGLMASLVSITTTPGVITKIGGGEVVIRYCDIKDTSFTGAGATFVAVESKDSGNNLGITFKKALRHFLPFF